MSTAASSSVALSATTTGSSFIHCRTRASLECTRAASARRRSRDVMIPTRRPYSATSAEPTSRSRMCSAASPSVSSGFTTSTSVRIRSPAVVGFNLRFHTIARAQLIGEYENPAS